MAVKLNFVPEENVVKVDEPASVSSLVHGHYGVMHKGVITLFPEEALYLMDIRNARCYDAAGNEYKFNDLAGKFPGKKQMARYFTFKDWRDRGLILRPVSEVQGKYGRNPVKKYPSSKFPAPKYAVRGLLFADDLVTVIDDEAVGKELYETYWLGQFGSYKAEQRGKLSKLDVYETLFMMNHCGLGLSNAKEKEVIKLAKKRRPDFLQMYEVFEDWRLRGYVLKTGFKFGTHFRVYFPGASPTKSGGEWVHSKHVIHVFPRSSKMLISEWARAIRVAHSVKKTFILAIPGEKKEGEAGEEKKAELDFLLYHRKKGGIETPKEDKPRFLMLSFSEEEYIGGEELAEAIVEAKEIGLELILAISDRETSVTYYRVKRFELPGSKYEYYEIEWEQP
ncbi:tRNA-intron lyase [Candidatus Micrarchaeota archaeon]|nr:tRNA-intron lyase [Candidatus Micrarchaeota archaeon]